MEEAFSSPDSPLLGPLSDSTSFDDFMDDFFSKGFSGYSPKGETTATSASIPVDSSNAEINNGTSSNQNQNPLAIIDCSGQSMSVSVGEIGIGFRDSDALEPTINPHSALTRKRWVDPRFNGGSLSHLRERFLQALNYIKDSSPDGGDVLVQIWVPMKKEGKVVLTTRGQPFVLDPNSERLVNYRAVSTDFQFSAEENSNELLGLPGRVFLGRLPEWTPDVQFFSSIEYPRVGFAQRYNVRGTIALPVFEQGSQSCLGVIEVVMTTQRINYRPELEKICRALQAVNLRSSEGSSIPPQKVGSDCYQAAIPDILEVLKSICNTHKLPLAQTWMFCIEQGKKGSRHSDENYMNCVSPVDGACHVTDPRVWGFQEACSEHHLFKGQGVAGKAFTTNEPCFFPDITELSKAEYPLVHYARMFGLRAAVAIRMRSIYTGNLDFVLEFFLPVDYRDSVVQRLMLNSLSITIQQVSWSLRVVTDKELGGETLLQVKQASPSCGKEPSCIASAMQSQLHRKNRISPSPMPPGFQKHDMQGPNASSSWILPAEVLSEGRVYSELKQRHQDSAKHSFDAKGLASGEVAFTRTSNTQEKKRAKPEKNISLQVLRQYFTGNLKDAAKSLGVCPTTMKKICRQHGISRWPSRKIKKVDHSMKKLQDVINSVQEAGGALSSFYESLPKAYALDLTSLNLSASTTLFQTSHPDSLTAKPEGLFSTQVAKSKSPSSSCSQSSGSSHSCSSGDQQHPSAVNIQCGTALKRAHSEAALDGSSRAEPNPPAKSPSQKSLTEIPGMETPSTVPKNGSSHGNSHGSIRFKVSYGEENVRFRIQPSWTFQDLKEEVAKRFHIGDMSTVDLKYLDDDFELVLLTCDADLQECIDVYRSSCSSTVKLSIHNVALPNTGISLGSTTLS